MKSALGTALLLLALPACALEVVNLNWAHASEIAAALRPTLQTGESLSAFENKLIINARPAREAELAQIARELDVQPAMLNIEVEQNKAAQDRRIEIDLGNGSQAGGWSVSSGSRQGNSRQNLSLLSGKSGSISLGETRPLPWWFAGHGAGQTAISGFEVTPRLRGNQVLLDIAVRNEALGKHDTSQQQTLVTTLSAPLGQWVTLGSIHQDGRGGRIFIFGGQAQTGQSERTVRLRVNARQ
ncbi:secretin N-terminal domain-containing protein [Craterilacuibacter sp.]|uniref:secretin N-terminal domain-containing protein n=1 Tax=Craterilacuibacter sp. TaxID=2870909 RepID=UPI003F2A1A39